MDLGQEQRKERVFELLCPSRSPVYLGSDSLHVEHGASSPKRRRVDTAHVSPVTSVCSVSGMASVPVPQHEVQGVTLCVPLFLQRIQDVGLSGQELTSQQHRGLMSSGPGKTLWEGALQRGKDPSVGTAQALPRF